MNAIEVATRQREALIQTVGEVLGKNQKVVVVGWRDSNHSPETREIARTGLVEFVLDPPSRFGSNVGLILFTKFHGHAKFYQLRKNSFVHPVILSNGTIKKILEGSRDSFVKAQDRITKEKLKAGTDLSWPVAVSAVVNHLTADIKPTSIAEHPQEQVMSENPTETPVTLPPSTPDFEKFKRLFTEQSEVENGMVGKVTLGNIRRQCGLEKVSNHDLVKQGYVISVVSEGRTHAGRYRAGAKMTSEVTPPHRAQEINDPIVKARILIGNEAMVMDEIRTIETRLENLKLELTRIKEARELIERIENMFK